MPIYEYACPKCDSEFEVEQRITEDPLKTCPKCRSRRIKRLISQTSFALKGGGWYADGYAGNAAATGSDGKPGDGKPGDGKPGDGKPGDGDLAAASASDSAAPKGGSGSGKKAKSAAKGKKAVA
jgi:putative FmdB family regulatory protein